jgi:hypothetical protein
VLIFSAFCAGRRVRSLQRSLQASLRG